MMPHAPRVAHAAGGDDDMPAAKALDVTALARRFRESQPRRAAKAGEGIPAGLITAVSEKHFGRSDSKRAIEKDRAGRRGLFLHQRDEVAEQFLRSLDGEGGNKKWSPSAMRGGDLAGERGAALARVKARPLPVAVGAFHNEVIDVRWAFRVGGEITRAWSDVAGKQQAQRLWGGVYLHLD